MLSSHDFLGRLRLRRAARSLCQRADDAAAREIDLEAVMLVAPGVAEQRVGGAREGLRVGRLPAERSFGLRVAPRPVGDAAEREAPLLDGLAIELKPDGDGDER